MRLATISDIHDNLILLAAVLGRIIFLGDLVTLGSQPGGVAAKRL